MGTRIQFVRTAAFCLVLLVGFGAGTVFYKKAYAQTVRKPMLIQSTWQLFREDGSLGDTLVMTEAVRSDASWMKDTEMASGMKKNLPTREIYSVSDAAVSMVDPELRIVMSRPLSAHSITWAKRPVATDCLAAHPGMGVAHCEEAGKHPLGYPVHKVTRVFSESNGAQIMTEDLVAKDLDWRILDHKSYTDGRLKDHRAVTALALGEPAPGLFEIPKDYRVVSKPSEFMELNTTRRGQVTSPAALAAVDERFARRGQ
jgi:hypothetical protein